MGIKKSAKSSKPLRKNAMKTTKGGISGRITGIAVDPSDPTGNTIKDGTSNTILFGEVVKP